MSPSTRGQPTAIRSTPNQPNRSMTVASANWAAIRTDVVATIPMRGPATVMARMMSALMTPPRSIHFGEPNASPMPGERAASEKQHDEREQRADERRRGHRLDGADPFAEPSLHGDLNRSPEPCGEGQQGGEGGRAHGEDAIRSPASPTKERHVIRAIILYESEPDPERYQQHLDEFTRPRRVRGLPARQGVRLAVR